MSAKTFAKKLPAYVIMPVVFAILGYLLIWLAGAPVLDAAASVVGMLSADEAPNFNADLKNIYDPNAQKYTPPETDVPAEDNKPAMIPLSEVTFPEWGERYAQLSCERIGLDCAVYRGDTNDLLRHGAGHYKPSFLPGFGRLILLCGHNNTHFKPLKKAEVGDIFIYDTNYQTYVYEAVSVDVYDEKELEKIVNTKLLEEEETLILYTCYPFHAITGRKTDRWTVTCKLVSGLSVKWRYDQ